MLTPVMRPSADRTMKRQRELLTAPRRGRAIVPISRSCGVDPACTGTSRTRAIYAMCSDVKGTAPSFVESLTWRARAHGRLTMPTAYLAGFRHVSCGAGCGGLGCTVGGAYSLGGGPDGRLVMQVAVRFSM